MSFVASLPDSAGELDSSADDSFSSSLGEQSRIFYFGFIDYLQREQGIDKDRISHTLGWMKAFAKIRSDHTPLNSQVRIFITSIARASDVEQLSEYLRELLDLIDSRVALAVRRVVAILFHENYGDYYARNLAQAARNCGIELDLRASTMQIQQDWLDGKLFDTDTISGVGDEYWGQLSVIFQEVVHELSQPVMAILSRIEALNRVGPMGISTEVMDSSLLVLRNYADRIGERLRHYSALAFEGGISKWTDLPALVREISSDSSVHAKATSVEIAIDVSRLGKGKFVFGPPLQLRIAIQNLFRNAINALSAVERERRIQVSIHSIKYDFETVFVQISDNGPGIPEDLKQNIFEKGFTTKTGHGLGLGLALAASTISSMGGQLKLEQSDSSGSTFLIVLPSGALEERFNEVQQYDKFNELNELGQG
jgi:signal transduction histidine kinase